jgi:DNA (cytosine-5)-methyltransferase 1
VSREGKGVTFGSLFAGIGGFDLGLERAGMECRWQVEIDPFCRKVLEKHWPHVPKYEDVRTVGAHNLERVDLIVGGFPCQDISYAGFGAGLDGERSGLWYEFARILGEMGPRYALVENVTALLDRGMGDVLGTLADLGFDAEWSSISACAVGAAHVRQRVFIVAYANGVDGREGLRDSIARAFRPLQTLDGFEGSRARTRARLAHPSELYGGADGAADGSHRNRGIGNAVYPDVAEWIGQRVMQMEREQA